MGRLCAAWSLFLLRGPSPPALRLLGAALGFAALKDLLWSLVAYTGYAIPHRFQWPYLPVPAIAFTHEGERVAYFIQGLAIFGALSMMAGVWRRLGALLLLLCYGYSLAADRLSYTNNVYVFLVLTACCLVGAGPDPRASAAAGRVGQLFVASIYLTGALTKMTAFWCSGAILREALFTYQEVYTRWVNRDVPALFALMSWGTIGAELLLALGLFHRRTRPWAIGVGVALHAGIEFFLPVRMFSYAMAASYLLFLDRGQIMKIEAALGRVGPLWRAFAGLGGAWLLNRFFARMTGNYEYHPQADFALLSAFLVLAAAARHRGPPSSSRPERSRVTDVLRALIPAWAVLQGWLLLKPALGGTTDFSFRLFTEIVQVRVELWTQQEGAWTQQDLYGASHRWNSESALYTWGNWADERVFLERYAGWVAGRYPEAQRVRVVAYVQRDLGPEARHQWELPAAQGQPR